MLRGSDSKYIHFSDILKQHLGGSYIEQPTSQHTKQIVNTAFTYPLDILLSSANNNDRLRLFNEAFDHKAFDHAHKILNAGEFDYAKALNHCVFIAAGENYHQETMKLLAHLLELTIKKFNSLNHDTVRILVCSPYIQELQKKLTDFFHENPHLQLALEQDLAYHHFFYMLPPAETELLHRHGIVTTRFNKFIKNLQNVFSKSWRNGILPKYLDYPEYIAEIFGHDTRELHQTLDNSDPAILYKLIYSAIHYPNSAKFLAPKLASLKKIEICDGGTSEDTWTMVTKKLIEGVPPVKENHPSFKPPLNEKLSTPLEPLEKSDINILNNQQWKFLRLQGRTILMQNSAMDILAIKVQKVDEPFKNLTKEFKTIKYYLHAQTSSVPHKLHLKSYFPTPITINNIPNLIDWLCPHLTTEQLNAFIQMVGNHKTHIGFIYQVNASHSDYFTYLHDVNLSDQQFSAANRMMINDLCQLLSHGIVYDQLADIFHNRENNPRQDAGRYLVLIAIMWNIIYKGRQIEGSGRLHHWRNAVAYPNIRGTGGADWGDWSPFVHWLHPSDQTKKYFSLLFDDPDKMGNLISLNILAEYQYIPFLIAGQRASDLDALAKQTKKSASDIFSIWQIPHAQQIIDNCALMIAHFTYFTEKQARKFLMAMVDINRLARQMQFWMTNEYIPYVIKENIPPDIYGKETTVEFGEIRAGTFNASAGFAMDGKNSDLGPVNGQEPIKEANKLFYWMVNTILIAYHQYRLTFEDLDNIIKTEKTDPSAAELIRQESFKHLPAKEYHGMMFALTKRRLIEKNPSPTERVTLLQEAQQHQREYAAAVIQRHWRNR